MTGTSQATAFVTGVAALIVANNPEFDYKQVREKILSSADQSAELVGKSKTAGILNSWAALAMQPAISASGAILARSTPTFPNETTDVVSSTGNAASLRQQLGGLMNVLRVPATGRN